MMLWSVNVSGHAHAQITFMAILGSWQPAACRLCLLGPGWSLRILVGCALKSYIWWNEEHTFRTGGMHSVQAWPLYLILASLFPKYGEMCVIIIINFNSVVANRK